MINFEIQILGTGAGASQVYDGLPSSSFMLLQDSNPLCLVDLGLGIGREVIERYGCFPKDIIITHNHSDHAGDLPVVLRVELASGNKNRVVCAQEVAPRIQKNRLAEHLDQIPFNELADWLTPSQNIRTKLNDFFDIEFFQGNHSELSFGFILYHGKRAVLAYTGDSTLEPTLFSALSRAETFIIDARPKVNAWHASFADIKTWLKQGCYIIGHGLSDSQTKDYPELPLLKYGQKLSLLLE